MWSRIAIITALLVSLLVINNRRNWDHGIPSFDAFGYYNYLPATIIYNDVVTYGFFPPLYEKYRFGGSEPGRPYGNHKLDNGNQIDKYPMGLAIAELPFFLVAHAWCKITGAAPADGYATPYALAVILTYPVLLVIGLAITRRLLLRYYSDGITAITLMLLFFGTNLYHYTAFDQGMSHPLSFTLFAAFVYLTDSWHRTPHRRYLYLMGLLLGWIIITRPVNGLIVILPLLWQAGSISDMKAKGTLLIRSAVPVAIAGLLCIAVCSLQMAYWYQTSGRLITYSYEGEHFFFLKPKIWKGLFSFRKGWFIYTPVAFVGMAGLWHLRKMYSWLIPAIVVFYVLMIYVVFSWGMWWYGGSFGCRPLIETLAVLSLPLAAFIEWLSRKSKPARITGTVILCSFIALNMFQSYQYSRIAIHWDRMTFQAWCKSFGKVEMNYDEYEQYLIDGDTYWKERAEISR